MPAGPATLSVGAYDRCVDYALGLLLPCMLASLGGAIIYDDIDKIRHNPKARVCIVKSSFFGPGYGTVRSLPQTPLAEIEGVPLLYGSPHITRQGDCLVVHADIVASAFFMATRYEEVVRRDARGLYGRFKGRESLPYRAGFLHRPIVDEYAQLLRKWLKQAGVDLPAPQRKFQVCLGHDVDTLKKYRSPMYVATRLAKALLGRPVFSKPLEAIAVAGGFKKDPYDNLDLVMSMDGSFPDPATKRMYFFLTRTSYVKGSYTGGDYDLKSPRIQRLIKTIQDHGDHIALHASYEAGLDPTLLAGERAALEEAVGTPIEHNRHHFLAWLEPEAGWDLAKAGIRVDHTIGYADISGFRLGVCRPIPLFDPVRCELFGIEEHPLIIMERTLQADSYMGLSAEAALQYAIGLLEQTRKHEGEFSLLWHNTAFETEPGNYLPSLYQRLGVECRIQQDRANVPADKLAIDVPTQTPVTRNS